jgi:hypothetical protein
MLAADRLRRVPEHARRGDHIDRRDWCDAAETEDEKRDHDPAYVT